MGFVDIGSGVSIEVRFVPDGFPETGEVGGVAYVHNCNGQQREDYVPVWGPGELWTVMQREPLTLSPSLLCRACAHHGFITNGKWVPA